MFRPPVPYRLARVRPALAALCLLLLGCERRAAPPVAVEDLAAGPAPTYESWDVRFDVSENERRRVRLRAPYLARFELGDSSYVDLSGGPAATYGADTSRADVSAARVEAVLFDEDGAPSTTVRSDRLRYVDEERRFVAEGGVVVSTRNDRRLETEHLLWDEAAREVRTSGFVRISTPTETIQGYGLVADEALENYVLSRVTGQVTVEE